MIFGNWRDVLMGLWGGVEITAQGITRGDSGGLTVRVFQDVDVVFRHAVSFSVATDV